MLLNIKPHKFLRTSRLPVPFIGGFPIVHAWDPRKISKTKHGKILPPALCKLCLQHTIALWRSSATVSDTQRKEFLQLLTPLDTSLNENAPFDSHLSLSSLTLTSKISEAHTVIRTHTQPPQPKIDMLPSVVRRHDSLYTSPVSSPLSIVYRLKINMAMIQLQSSFLVNLSCVL